MSDDRSGTDTSGRAASAVERRSNTIAANLLSMPTVSLVTVGVALLGLPGLVALVGALELAPGPLAEIALQWTVALVALGVVVGVEKRSLASVGFRRPAWRDIAYIVVTAAVVLAVFVFGPAVLAAAGLPAADGVDSLESPSGVGVALLAAVTTGVVEEILYRGYPLERLLEYTDSAPVAGGLTLVVFTLAHLLAWPVGSVLLVGAVSAVLTVVYLRRRTLVPVVGAHAGIWALAVLGQYYG